MVGRLTITKNTTSTAVLYHDDWMWYQSRQVTDITTTLLFVRKNNEVFSHFWFLHYPVHTKKVDLVKISLNVIAPCLSIPVLRRSHLNLSLPQFSARELSSRLQHARLPTARPRPPPNYISWPELFSPHQKTRINLYELLCGAGTLSIPGPVHGLMLLSCPVLGVSGERVNRRISDVIWIQD